MWIYPKFPWCWNNQQPLEGINLGPYFTPLPRINFTWVKEQNVKNKAINVNFKTEENVCMILGKEDYLKLHKKEENPKGTDQKNTRAMSRVQTQTYIHTNTHVITKVYFLQQQKQKQRQKKLPQNQKQEPNILQSGMGKLDQAHTMRPIQFQKKNKNLMN